MKWPWVSARKHANAIGNCREYCDRMLQAQARSQALELALNIEKDLRRDEQWRRLKAEGELAYARERIKRVLGLPIWPASDEEKKAG